MVGTADGRVICIWVQISAKAMTASNWKDDLSDSDVECPFSADTTILTERLLSDTSLEFACYEEANGEDVLVCSIAKNGTREMFLCSMSIGGEPGDNKLMVVDGMTASEAGKILDRYV